MPIWKDIERLSGRYQVSNEGQVRFKACTFFDRSGRRITRRHKILAQGRNQDGYSTVRLTPPGTFKVRVYVVHRLVLEAFVGPRPEGMQACHFPDRTRTNNALKNLRWGTVQDNADDRVTHDMVPKGERSPNHKLTEEAVRICRSNYKAGSPTSGAAALARRFNVSQTAVKLALAGKTWACVK